MKIIPEPRLLILHLKSLGPPVQKYYYLSILHNYLTNCYIYYEMQILYVQVLGGGYVQVLCPEGIYHGTWIKHLPPHLVTATKTRSVRILLEYFFVVFELHL